MWVERLCYFVESGVGGGEISFCPLLLSDWLYILYRPISAVCADIFLLL